MYICVTKYFGMSKDLSNYRRVYQRSELDKKSVPENPVELFRNWFNEAEKEENCIEVNAMSLGP